MHYSIRHTHKVGNYPHFTDQERERLASIGFFIIDKSVPKTGREILILNP